MFRKIVFGLMCLLFVSALEAQAQARITASAMDSDGNVYVTGWRYLVPLSNNPPYDIATVKYDKNGDLLWSHGYPGVPTIPEAEGWGIAVDPSRNVYVAGHVTGAFGVDCLLIKYPHDYMQGRDPEWVRTYDGGVGNDQNWCIAIDSDGYIYVTGYSVQVNAGVSSQDISTMKYDSQGNVVWARLYNGPANINEQAFAIAVDPVSKSVYVTGTSRFSTATTALDMITIMYDEHGTEQWVRLYDGPGNGQDRGTSLALDADGNVYVTGYSAGANQSLDYATIKYDVGGNEMWVARYDGPAGGNDQPAPPVGSASGATYSWIQNNQGIIVTDELLDPVPALEYLIGQVSGLDVNRGIKNSLRVKLDACLKSLLAANADLRENAHRVLGAFVNQLRDLVAEKVISNDTANELIAIANQIIKGILGIETTVVYVAGQSTGVGTSVDFAVVKYNAADGSPMWNLPGQPGTTPEKPGTPPNIALRYNGPLNHIDRAWGMAIDRDGHIYVTGPSFAKPAPWSVDYFTVKYFVNTYLPVPLAEGRYDGPGTTTGLDQSCGFATWRDPASGRHYIFRDPSTDEDYVCVTGNSHGAGNYNEYAAVMYSGNLVERWVRRYY